MDEKTKAIIAAKGNEIAHLILSVDYNHRGDILKAAATRCREMGQNYTGHAIATAARQYGCDTEREEETRPC